MSTGPPLFSLVESKGTTCVKENTHSQGGGRAGLGRFLGLGVVFDRLEECGEIDICCSQASSRPIDRRYVCDMCQKRI